jgi:NAD(P)H-dependent flavin oxidoreductase YrpB (nitropropane dioxygenase family)
MMNLCILIPSLKTSAHFCTICISNREWQLNRNFWLQRNDIHRFAGAAPNATATGHVSSMVMYAGQGVGLITEIIPAGEVVQRLSSEKDFLICRKRL